MKIYIDFDRTLFDCDRFLEDIYKIIDKYHIPKELFKECQSQCKRKGFNPYLILNKVEKSFSFNEKLYQEVALLMSNTANYLYSDSISFLKYLKEKGYYIVILTKGNKDYQREKISNTTILNYCDELMITMKHKGKLNIDYQNSLFIDDNPVEISSILEKKPKGVFRVKRPNSRYNDIDIPNVININSLDKNIYNSF